MSDGTVKRIDTKSFSDCIAALGTAIAAFSGARSKAEASVATLYETWAGEGRTAFQRACKSLLVELSDEEENLGEIRTSLESILATYETWDEKTGDAVAHNTLE